MSAPSQPPSPVATHDRGLQRSLKNRHIQLIALGGAIGTGLFYGSSASITMAGPAILLAYLLGGAVIFLIMRALGEMSVHTPVSGAFSHYAYENWGAFPGFFSGWNYWFNYIAVSMAELVVVGSYVQFWFPGVPEWVSSAVFLVLVTAINLVSVRAFGEFEFWFAIIKVTAIVAMILFGLGIICFGWGNGGDATGISNLWAHGGFFPTGISGLTMAMVVVLFSFGGVELIGITAGEADDPRRSIPKAINQVVARILIFYVGAIFVMLCLFPWNQVGKEGSPFVTIFSKLGIGSAATILNVVVLTAAVSAYNSGLYSNGRMLYSLARQGNAPAVLGRLNKAGSPWVGVLASSAVTALAVLLNFLLPGKVFLYVISVALIAGIFNWAMIVVTQLKFRQRLGADEVSRLGFRMPWSPWSNYLVLACLAGVVVLMAFIPDYRVALYVGPAWIALLALAHSLRRRTR
ncbi:amino acid/polyamine/organocation transporter (APC superfamily) [Luteococcus japonicus]|uniref:Amino acid/polyamine/organocation transporter (APC superfamily) n=1 Tax=Luteococcus japonicus TaxID=33984 RepID=A0A3N1ZWU7_9ACTN|nr:amino acid permease [Luteococcus japonicus]ROR55296.1 amino acid/polyamine/organocation transporter (APC superfamily) [Luteococcus japonicus]